MIIKKFLEYFKEKNIGEYIENVSKGDEYLLALVGRYTSEISPDIKISNAVNTLSLSDQHTLLKMVDDYRNGTIEDKDVDVMTYVDLVDESNGGKNIFKSFLKVITALGLKSNSPSWDKTPNDYLIYYLYENVDFNKVKLISQRFKSIHNYVNLVDYREDICSLYYGIKCDGVFEYGIISKGIIPFGNFKVNKGIIKWLTSISSPSFGSIKKELLTLDFNEIRLFCLIKNEMTNFKPVEKFNPDKLAFKIVDSVISFEYYGIGKWEDGEIDQLQLNLIKERFKKWLSGFRWSDKILVSVTASSFKVYFNFKIK